MKFYALTTALFVLICLGNCQSTAPNPFAMAGGKPIFVVMHPNMFEQLGLPKLNSIVKTAQKSPGSTPIVTPPSVLSVPTIPQPSIQSKLVVSIPTKAALIDPDFDQTKFQTRLGQNQVLKPIQHIHNKNSKPQIQSKLEKKEEKKEENKIQVVKKVEPTVKKHRCKLCGSHDVVEE